MIGEILTIIAPVFLVAGIGFFLEMRGLGFHAETLSRLAMLLGTPALVFSSLTNTQLPDDALLGIIAIALVAVVIGFALAGAILMLLRQPVRSFLSPLSLPNAGNAGLPLVFFAFAEPGLTIGAAFFFIIALVQYIVVPAIVTGQVSLSRLLREPLVWSVIAVLAFRATDIRVPTIIADTTAMLGGLMIPVMLILLGGALARLKISDLMTSLMLAAVRLVVGVVTGLIVITLFALEGVEAGAIFLLCAMPSALITYVIAEYYGDRAERVAGVVVCSTVLNFACLPLLILVAIHLAEM